VVAANRERAQQVAAAQQITVSAAARRVAKVLNVDAPAAGPALSDGELVAAASVLLLLVAAAASVLRLSIRMAGEPLTGRFG
jgi:hypothetical protein